MAVHDSVYCGYPGNHLPGTDHLRQSTFDHRRRNQLASSCHLYCACIVYITCVRNGDGLPCSGCCISGNDARRLKSLRQWGLARGQLPHQADDGGAVLTSRTSGPYVTIAESIIFINIALCLDTFLMTDNNDDRCKITFISFLSIN